MTTRLDEPHACQCIVHTHHGSCGQACTVTAGCVWPVPPVMPPPGPAAPQPVSELRRAIFLPDLTEIGPALHPTQIRAQALMSAVTLYASNVASGCCSTPADRPRLETGILDTAKYFEAYIRGAQ